MRRRKMQFPHSPTVGLVPTEEKEEREVRREAFGSGQSWPRRHEADGGQEAYRRACPECRKVKRKTLGFIGFLDFALGMKRLPCHRLG